MLKLKIQALVALVHSRSAYVVKHKQWLLRAPVWEAYLTVRIDDTLPQQIPQPSILLANVVARKMLHLDDNAAVIEAIFEKVFSRDKYQVKANLLAASQMDTRVLFVDDEVLLHCRPNGCSNRGLSVGHLGLKSSAVCDAATVISA